jgi:hypothetical protein
MGGERNVIKRKPWLLCRFIPVKEKVKLVLVGGAEWIQIGLAVNT